MPSKSRSPSTEQRQTGYDITAAKGGSASPAFDAQEQIAELRLAMIRLADAKSVDQNLMATFDQLVIQLQPLQSLAPLRRNPRRQASAAFQDMRSALRFTDLSNVSRVHLDTSSVSFIGAVPTSSLSDGTDRYERKAAL